MQRNESGPSVLEYLSFNADRTTQEMTIPTTPRRRYGSPSSSGPNESSRSMHMQGILWKRRDVFRNHWRPRWFVLHSDQCVLTYYLLANQDTEQVVSGGAVSTPSRRRPTITYGTPSSLSISSDTAANSTRHNYDIQDNNRRRTFSDSSSISANTIDCDVVPRGTIYLLGSTVEANEALTRPQEDLYALTITDHENSTHCHMSARTIESRDQWIHRIRRVCQREHGAQYQEQRQPSAPDSNKSSYSPRISINRNTGRADAVIENRIVARENFSDKNDQSGLQQNDQRNGTNNTAGESLRNEGKSLGEKDVLILFAPLVLYKVLMMVSLLRFAALCFVVTSTAVLRWILIQHLLTVAKVFIDDDQNESTYDIMPIGHGSICCRFTEDLTNVYRESNEVSLSHILVWSLAKAIHQQPRLVSKKYNLLPSFYSTDVVYLDHNNKSADESGGIRVNKVDEKNLGEIIDCFTSIKQQQQSPVAFLQQAIGPACRIVSTFGDEDDDDSQQVYLDLNLTDCPITVFVSRAAPIEEGKKQEACISINFQSTDMNLCRNFVKDLQQSIRSAEVWERN